MSIEANYQTKIEEIKQAADDLNAWETKFIFGDEDSRPIWERPELSIKQKGMVDRIFKERVEGKSREDASVIDFGNPRVTAVVTEGKAYRVVVDGMQVGPIINNGEATAVVGWLSSGLSEQHIALSIPGADAVGAGEAAEQDFPTPGE